MAAIMEMGGDKANRHRAKIRSAETTVTIKKGAPTFYNMNGTNDGIDALSAEAIPAAKHGFFAGIAMQDVEPGRIKEVLTHGTCEYARLLTASRAATTDVWASYPAGVTGDVLSVLSGAGLQAFSRAGAASAGILPWAVLAGTYASATTQASSVGSANFSASTWSVSLVKVFIRPM
jgi:hypothetical protein